MQTQDVLERARTDRKGLFNKDRLTKGMSQHDLDAVIAISGINVTYTAGIHTDVGAPRMLTYVVTTADGNSAMITDEATAYYSREYSWIDDVRHFRYTANTQKANKEGVAILGDVLKELGLTEGKIGIELTFLPALYWDELKSYVPKVNFVNGNDIFEFARMVKTEDEIELFKIAVYYSDKAIHSAWAQTKAGFTEKTVASMMESNALHLGAEGLDHTHLHSGIHSTVVHALPMEKSLEPGEVVHIDFGAVFCGYSTDISRNAVVHNANSKQESIYKRLWEIEQVLYENIRPGINAHDLYEIGMKEFDKAGLVYPWGTLGHSTGLAVHEGFEIAQGSEQVIEEGMIINIEPSHIEQGDARYHIEDSVLITSDGMELLSNFMNTENMFVIR